MRLSRRRPGCHEVAGYLSVVIQNRGGVNAQLAASLKVGTPFGDVPLSNDESGRLGVR